jgi:universal stress protein A
MTLFRHVLASVDLSERSRHTALQAANVARSCNATLTLLHVLPARPRGIQTDDRDAIALAGLKDIAHELRMRWPARVAVGEGDTRTEVRRYALDQGADLIVVGSRHRPLLERMFVESVGQQVTSAGDWSVLAVPEPDDEARRPPANPWEILCAIDLSDTSAAVLETAVSLARVRRAHLTVLHAIARGPWYDSVRLDHSDEARRRQAAQAARERLSKVLAAHTGPALDVETLIAFGPADEQILQTASGLRADLLIVGAHANRMAGDSSLGPTATRVLHHAPCPLLLVRTQTASAGIEASALAADLVGSR